MSPQRRMVSINPLTPEQDLLRDACSVLRQGGIVAFPTETFYGLAADAWNERALSRIFALKKRSHAKPLLVIIADRRQLPTLATNISEPAARLMDSFWPGPLTIILEAKAGLPRLLTAGTGTIGVRISSHPVAQRLSSLYGLPLTATSANISGGKNPVTAEDVANELGEGLDIIFDGGRAFGIRGSTIVDTTVAIPRVVRVGDCPIEEIRQVISRSSIYNKE